MSTSVPSENIAAIILCGGNSVRMGFDKSMLPLGDGQTFLDNIVFTLKGHVNTIVAVCNQDRPAPSDPEIICVCDRQPNLGPMEGIASGLSALPNHIQAAFVTSCDVPLIRPEVIGQLATALNDFDGVTPIDGERVYGLTAIYRKSVLPTLDQLIFEKMLKVADLAQHLHIRQVSIDLIRAVDPLLESLTNVNSLQDYQKLAKQLGFELDPEIASKLSD
jgi:molybdopterin-guanine dinucleotide biosynthesis protein A